MEEEGVVVVEDEDAYDPPSLKLRAWGEAYAEAGGDCTAAAGLLATTASPIVTLFSFVRMPWPVV